VYSNTALTLKGGFGMLGVCSSKLCFGKLARPAAYGAVDRDSPEAGLAPGLTIFVD